MFIAGLAKKSDITPEFSEVGGGGGGNIQLVNTGAYLHASPYILAVTL
jgi:hypothetical protein